MTKTKLILVTLVLALVGFASLGTASAQDQTATASPGAVPEPGTYDIAVSAEGFTVDSVNFAICNTGNTADLGGSLPGMIQYCGGLGEGVDVSSGSFTTMQSVEITDAGVTFMFFEPREGGELASVSVNIDEDMMDGELANTGINSSLLVIIGFGIALAGVMVSGLSRRLRTVQ